MDANEDIVSELETLQNKIEDLEVRVSEILAKQLYTKQDLDLIQETPENADDYLDEGKPELQLPDDNKFTEEVKTAMENMITSQKSLQESIQTSKSLKTSLGGFDIFKEINEHISNRLDYLETVKTLLEGPLLEEKDSPPPPEEEKPEEELQKDVKDTTQEIPKGKKGDGEKNKTQEISKGKKGGEEKNKTQEIPKGKKGEEETNETQEIPKGKKGDEKKSKKKEK